VSIHFLHGISVCIPAYNEEATIESAVTQIEAVLRRMPCDYEIIICDDASADGTGTILRRLSSKNPRLRPIFHEKNRGIRATFEELYAAATKDAVFLIPSDLEWPIVIASRINKNYGMARTIVSTLFNLIPWVLFGVRISDAGAVKLVRKELILETRVISQSPFSEAERIVRAVRAGYRVESVPTITRRREAGVSHAVRLKVLVAAATDVWRVWWDIRVMGR
jgi:glycosyltransferase involved in cell wall biosynthesis